MGHISELFDRRRAHDRSRRRRPRRSRSSPTRTCYRSGRAAPPRLLMIRRGALRTASRRPASTPGFGNEWIRIGGVKYVADGSASERTMRMSTPYVGTERLRHPDDDAAGDRRGGRGRAPAQLPGRHPRQRRRHHRHGAQGLRARAREVARSRPPPPHRALHARQPDSSVRRIKATGVDPDAVLDLRLLPRRKVGASTATTRCAGCSRTARSSTPASRCPARPTTRPGRSSR